MKKRYEVKGMMEWHPMFVAGRARVRVSFTGGHLGEGCVSPARFETSDPVVQRLIEKSAAFRSGRIRLAACIYGNEEAEGCGADRTPAKKVEAPTAQETVWPQEAAPASALEAESAGEEKLETMEFDSMEEAREYLNMNRQVRMSRLLDVKSCMREARKLGLEIKLP